MSFWDYLDLFMLLVFLVLGAYGGWHLYQLNERSKRLTAENQRMRRYLRRIAKHSEGDDLPFLPLEINDD